MDKTFSPSYSSSQVAYVEAETIEFSRFRFRFRFYRKRSACTTSASASLLVPLVFENLSKIIYTIFSDIMAQKTLKMFFSNKKVQKKIFQQRKIFFIFKYEI